MGSNFNLNSELTERLIEAMAAYSGNCGRLIDDVLHNEGGKLINDAIIQILPSSGREWNGKTPAARNAQPFRQENGSLSVSIRTKPAYHYLYFPDDGTTTRRHVGYKGNPRNFMVQGAESVSAEIIEKCINKLTEIIGE